MWAGLFLWVEVLEWIERGKNTEHRWSPLSASSLGLLYDTGSHFFLQAFLPWRTVSQEPGQPLPLKLFVSGDFVTRKGNKQIQRYSFECVNIYFRCVWIHTDFVLSDSWETNCKLRPISMRNWEVQLAILCKHPGWGITIFILTIIHKAD